jgi:hypothetical protein
MSQHGLELYDIEKEMCCLSDGYSDASMKKGRLERAVDGSYHPGLYDILYSPWKHAAYAPPRHWCSILPIRSSAWPESCASYCRIEYSTDADNDRVTEISSSQPQAL